jgi:hypothetical protein
MIGLLSKFGFKFNLRRYNLGQMRVAAFVRADIQPAVHRWVSSTEATGLGHVLSNKGGVGRGLHSSTSQLNLSRV